MFLKVSVWAGHRAAQDTYIGASEKNRCYPYPGARLSTFPPTSGCGSGWSPRHCSPTMHATNSTIEVHHSVYKAPRFGSSIRLVSYPKLAFRKLKAQPDERNPWPRCTTPIFLQVKKTFYDNLGLRNPAIFRKECGQISSTSIVARVQLRLLGFELEQVVTMGGIRRVLYAIGVQLSGKALSDWRGSLSQAPPSRVRVGTPINFYFCFTL